MTRKIGFLITLAVLVLIGASLFYVWLTRDTDSLQFATANAAEQEIKVVISTNGIIEPVSPGEIYAPIDGFVASIAYQEGNEIKKGLQLMRLESRDIRAAIAEASASLLDSKRQAKVILSGPSKEEVAALDGSIAECRLQLDQLKNDLQIEEALLAKKATTRTAVESLQKQRDLMQLRMETLEQKKADLYDRYSAEEKKWEQEKISELTRQVSLLEQQLKMESVLAPESGMIYSIPVKPGAFVTKGQLLAQVYKPGAIRLRAYVDEPDLGRVKKGQPARIEWDGMPDSEWTGVVETTAGQVVALNNRSIGNVLCSITSGPSGLIPNLNVKVEITTAFKANALTVPRSALFNYEGKTAVLLLEGKRKVVKPVDLGLITSEEVEILDGVRPGDPVILNAGDSVAGK